MTTDRVAASKEAQKPMSMEDWEINKSCAAKKRDHKWNWKYDPATNCPDDNLAICAHCGMETNLSRKGALGDGHQS